MTCYHPLRGFDIGLRTKTGKVDYKVVGTGVHHMELVNGRWQPAQTPYRSANAERCVYSYVEMPCGQCIGCRLQRSREWANRLMLELQDHEHAYFVTLTYNDEHVPRAWYADPVTGEAFQSLTLCKKDTQLFWKRLRKKFPDAKIRYYLCGEYGDTTARPHYHAILFGVDLGPLVPFGRSALGFQYYRSEALEEVWAVRPQGNYAPPEPIGHVLVAPVSWETCAYVARYCTKKLTGDWSRYYEMFSLVPPFTTCSTKPGIARNYYDNHPDIYEHEFINISTPKGGKKFRPPHYFDRLYDMDEPLKSAEMKAQRERQAKAAVKLKLKKTDMSYIEMLESEEVAKIATVEGKLKRNKV